MAHAAGQFRRAACGGVRQPYHADEMVGAGDFVGFGQLGRDGLHRQHDIAAHGEPGHQAVALEHQPTFGGGAGDGVVAVGEGASVRAFQPGDQVDQGGFAGAGEAEDGDEFAL